MLSMAFDFDDDISVILFDFCDGEWPIDVYEFFLFGMYWLKEHIGFIADLVIAHELLKNSLNVFELKAAAIQLNEVGFSYQLWSLEEEHEVDFYF